MGRHAYLIMAHAQFGQLSKLLRMLDDGRNDIYLHIDSKAGDFPKEMLRESVKKAGLYFTERTSVIWGAYSQIRCELILLTAAISENYDYYHLLSGADLPLKSQEEIHRFFDENKGKEFVDFEGPVFRKEKEVLLKYYYIFQEKIAGRNRWLDGLDQISIRMQRLMGVNRLREVSLTLQKGANWFSITDGLARYIVEQEPLIRQMFSRTKCCDEVFLQTLVWNSPYKERLYDISFAKPWGGFMRYIDWNRGTPYTFRLADFEELIHSECLFARKFDSAVDEEIIDKIAAYIQEQGGSEAEAAGG